MRLPVTRHGWPVYVVLRGSPSCLPVPFRRIMLLSASFSFAREVCFHFNRVAGKPILEVLRVTHVTRAVPVACQSSAFVRHTLDRHWARPPPVTSASSCQLCLEVRFTTAGPEHWVQGLHPLPKSRTRQQQGQHGNPECSHQYVDLNTITKSWGLKSPAEEALRCAKRAWIGPLYFAKAMSQHPPVELRDTIAEAAVFHQEICKTEIEADTLARESEGSVEGNLRTQFKAPKAILKSQLDTMQLDYDDMSIKACGDCRDIARLRQYCTKLQKW